MYQPTECYPTSTSKGHNNLVTFQEVLGFTGFTTEMRGCYPDGSLAMFPKLVHNPGFIELDHAGIIDRLGHLGLCVLQANGQGDILDTAQSLRNRLGFNTVDPSTRVHIPKTQAEVDIVLFALEQRPDVNELARYILSFSFSDFR